ncbi:MAG: hypothetical protein ACLFPQ_02890 [Candidatus Woesearchaeota archaeon]
MKTLVFDTGPLITLTLNNLLWVLDPMKERFKGEFVVPVKVKQELIDNPLRSKKYKLEALQILPYFNRNILKIFRHLELEKKTQEIIDLADNTFSAKGNYIKVVHEADVQVIASAIILNADAAVIDEYTARYLVENPMKIAKRMERKLHTNVSVNRENLQKLKNMMKGLKVLRSLEIIAIAYELGFLDRYLFEGEKRFVKRPKRTLLEAALWGIKLNGCSVSEKEIEEIMNLEEDLLIGAKV